jgi:phytoene/squalene synthetase
VPVSAEDDRAKDAQTQKMTRHGPLEDYCHEEAAEGAHGLLATTVAAAATTATATTTGRNLLPRARRPPTPDPH